MKRFALLPVAALLALGPTTAFSADDMPPPPPGRMGGPMKDMTLDEAREHAKDRLDKLNKMTPEEWEAHKKERADRREKFKNMPTEEREAMKEKIKERRKAGTPSPSGE